MDDVVRVMRWGVLGGRHPEFNAWLGCRSPNTSCLNASLSVFENPCMAAQADGLHALDGAVDNGGRRSPGGSASESSSVAQSMPSWHIVTGPWPPAPGCGTVTRLVYSGTFDECVERLARASVALGCVFRMVPDLAYMMYYNDKDNELSVVVYVADKTAVPKSVFEGTRQQCQRYLEEFLDYKSCYHVMSMPVYATRLMESMEIQPRAEKRQRRTLFCC